jgi:manganese/zinc/iron transport system substrate-binding protein
MFHRCFDRSVAAAATASVALLALAAAGVAGCSRAGAGTSQVRAVVTVGMIADVVRIVGGDRVQVRALMGAGVDPHLYKPGEDDVRALAEADIIFYNGLNLEGKMGDLFVKMAARKPTVAVTEDIPPSELREPPEMEGHYDPHVWFDVKLWMHAVRRIQRALSEKDPAGADGYRSRAEAYLKELDALDAEVRAKIAEIQPAGRRVLITAHDAFGYFGRAYGIRVEGLQGISTAADIGPADIKRLVDIIVENKVKAIFVESSIPDRNIKAVQAACRARGHDVGIGGSLFSDAMGDDGTPEGTYVGMVRHNARTVAEALK